MIIAELFQGYSKEYLTNYGVDYGYIVTLIIAMTVITVISQEKARPDHSAILQMQVCAYGTLSTKEDYCSNLFRSF